uniref:MARVEL domain-containing protein n=1 Tax=Romanomermis culicivorax TaxID=13658 RepID=A0A915K1G3_ROMCU
MVGRLTALLSLIFSITCLSITVAIVSIATLRKFFPFYEPCWTTPLYFVNAVFGLLAARLDKVNFFVAHLISSVLCVVFSIVLIIFGVVGWTTAGRSSASDEVTCIFFEHKYEKLKVVHYARDFDFANCVFIFKLATTFWTTFMILAVLLEIESFLNVYLHEKDPGPSPLKT